MTDVPNMARSAAEKDSETTERSIRQDFTEQDLLEQGLVDQNLLKLAQKTAEQGFHKYERTPRRVRGLLNGEYAFDTTGAYYIWEHEHYPQYVFLASNIYPPQLNGHP